MTRRAAVRQADVRRQATGLMRAALDCGLPANSFTVEVVDGVVRLLPIAANTPSDAASECERLMKEAFGE